MLIRIRIRRHDNKRKKTQVALYEEIIVFTISKDILYGQKACTPHIMQINLINAKRTKGHYGERRTR